MKNVTIPSQFLQELLALCGPEDHELRERVLKSATHPTQQWGIFALCFLYTASWAQGFWNNWVAAQAKHGEKP